MSGVSPQQPGKCVSLIIMVGGDRQVVAVSLALFPAPSFFEERSGIHCLHRLLKALVFTIHSVKQTMYVNFM